MSDIITAKILRQAAGVLLEQAGRMDGTSKPDQMTTYAGRSVTIAEAWAFMLEEIAARSKPHPWVDWQQGTPPSMAGDADDSPELDELKRAFGPFCDAATRENQKDSVGNRFFLPSIKKRAGLGRQAVRTVRDEIRGVWYSDWGTKWRTDSANIQYGIVPKQEVVQMLFEKTYD